MSATAPYRIGLVGVGKIARDQHLPALAVSDRFDLVACADPVATLPDLPSFLDLDAMLGADLTLDAISICTPPAQRGPLVAAAIDAGLHVMLEKPPAATLREVADFRARATARGVTIFAAWHSREASGVAPARNWLLGKRIDRVTIDWREDIRRWHPGQDWILGPNGFGVFDPGINALSILTAILPDPVTLVAARIDTPEGRQSPIAATLAMQAGAVPVTATFNFLQTSPQTWDISVITDHGVLTLSEGGGVMAVDGAATRGADEEYPRLYRRFADLIDRGDSDLDDTPLRLVGEALRSGERTVVERFEW